MVDDRLSYNGLHKAKDRGIQDILEMHLKSRSIDYNVSGEEQGDHSGIITGCNSRQDRKIVPSRTIEDNLISYTAITADPTPHEEQYLGLKSFLTACNGTYRSELMQLLFPVFSIFVVEQIEMDHFVSAQTFFNKYYSEHEEKYEKEVNELLLLTKSKDFVNEKSKIAHLKQKKCRIVLSSKIFNYLIQHLRNNNHSLLLQTINKNIDIKILDDPRQVDNKEWTEDDFEKNEQIFGDDEEVNKLNGYIQKVEKASKTKPSITLYSFVNSYQGYVVLVHRLSFLCLCKNRHACKMQDMQVNKTQVES